jgi:hypothetical protein
MSTSRVYLAGICGSEDKSKIVGNTSPFALGSSKPDLRQIGIQRGTTTSLLMASSSTMIAIKRNSYARGANDDQKRN